MYDGRSSDGTPVIMNLYATFFVVFNRVVSTFFPEPECVPSASAPEARGSPLGHLVSSRSSPSSFSSSSSCFFVLVYCCVHKNGLYLPNEKYSLR